MRVKAKTNDKEWITDYIRIKEAGLDFAYGRGDIEAARKIEKDIERLKIMHKKM